MITGKPLPPPRDEATPSQTEIDQLSKIWNSTVPQYYQTMLEAGKTDSRFDKGDKVGTFIHRKTGRVIERKEVNKVFMLFSSKLKVG